MDQLDRKPKDSVCVRSSPAAGIRLLLVGGYQAQSLGRRLLSPRSHPLSRHALWNHVQILCRRPLRAVTEPATCRLLTRGINRQRCCCQPWSSPSEASVKRRNRRSECAGFEFQLCHLKHDVRRDFFPLPLGLLGSV